MTMTPCPQCGEEIPFFETVDDLKQCPECGTPSDLLFDIAQGKVDQSPETAVADGGVVDE